MKVRALLQFTVFSAAAAAVVVFFSIWFESIIETFDDILVPCQYGTSYVNEQCSCVGTPFTGKYCGVCNCSHGYCVLGGTTPRISSDYGCECPRKSKYFGYLCDSCNTIDESTCEGECKDEFFGDKCQRVCYPSFSYQSTLVVASTNTCGMENKSGTGKTFETTINIDQCACGKRCLENTLCNSFTHFTIRDIPYCYLKTGFDVEDAAVGIYGRTKLNLQQGKCKSTRSAGGECNMCNGHGTCSDGRCECDKDWYDYKYEQCSVSCPKKTSVVPLPSMCKAVVEDAAECLDITTRLNQSGEYSLSSEFSTVHTQCYLPGCYITDSAAYFNNAVPETTVFFGAEYVTSLFGTSIIVPSVSQVSLTGGKIKGLQIGTHNMNYGPLNYFERDIKYVVERVENNVVVLNNYILSDGNNRMVHVELSTIANNNGGEELYVTVLNAMETDVSEYLTSVQLNNAWDIGDKIEASINTFTLFALSGIVKDCASSTSVEYICKELPCNGHGACVVNGNKPGCACEDGWVGEDCDIPCPGVSSGEGQCFGNGVCYIELDSNQNILTKCACGDMYRGEECSIQCPGEFNVPCSGHGTCDENGLCTCRSSPQWTGTGCSCSDLISCNGRGSCVDGKCLCDGNYAGSNCLECKENFYGSSCQFECKASQAGRIGDVLGCHGRGECIVTGMGTRLENVECACESESFTLIENGRVDIFSSTYSRDIDCSDCFSSYFPKYEVFEKFNKKNFELLRNDGLQTYNDLKQLAEDNGGRLPTLQEILDYNTSIEGGSNLFTPISDVDNTWAFIGTVDYHSYGETVSADWGTNPSDTDTTACHGTAATQFSPEQWVLVPGSAGKTFTLNYVSVAALNQTDCQYKCYDTAITYDYASFTTHDNSCRCSALGPTSSSMGEIGTTYVGDGIYVLEKRRCWLTTTLIVIDNLKAPEGIYIPCQFECTEETCNDLGKCNINYGEFGESLCSCYSGPNNDKHVKDSSFCTECDDNWYPLAPDADDGCTNFCIADLAVAPYNGDFPTVCDTGMIDCIECNGNGFCGPDGKCDCNEGFTGEECQIQCTSADGVICGGHGVCKTNALQSLLEHELEEIVNSGALYECECDPQDTISDEARDDFESNFELAEAPLKEYFGEKCTFYCEKPPWVDAGECNGLGDCTVYPIETPELETFKCNVDNDCNTLSIQQITSADNAWTQKKGPFCHKNIYPTILNPPASDRSASTGNAAHSLLNYDGVGLTALNIGQFLRINLQKQMVIAGFRIQSSGDFAILDEDSYVTSVTVLISADDNTYTTHENSLGTGLTSTVHENNVYFATPANAQYIKFFLAGMIGTSVLRIGIIVSPSQCQDPLVTNALCKDALRYQRPLHARSKYCVQNNHCKQKLDNYDWHSYCVNLNDAVTFKAGAETCGDMTHFCTTSPQSDKCYQYSLLGDTVTEIQQVNNGCYEADKIHYPFKITEAYRIDLGEEYFDQLYLPFSRHAKKFGKFTERINVLDYCNQYSKKFGLAVTSVARNERYLCGEDVLSEKSHCLYGLQEYEWKPFAVNCPTRVTKYATLKEAILNRNDGCVVEEVEPRTQLLNTPVPFGGFCYFNEDCQSGKCHENTCCSSTVDVTNCKSCNGNGECDSCVNGTTYNGTHCQHDTSCKMENGVKVCAYSYHFNFNGYCNYQFLVYPDGSSNPGTNALERTAECAKQCSRAIPTIYQNTSSYACSKREYWNIHDTSPTTFYNRDANRRLDDSGSAYTCRAADGGLFSSVPYSYVERRDDFISNAFLIAPNGGLCRCIEDKQIYEQNCGVSCDSGCESYYRTFSIEFKEFKDGVGFINVPNGNECELKEQCSSGECLEKCCTEYVPNCIKCNENGACIEYLNAGVHECTYPLIWEDDVGCVNTSSTTLVEALDLVDATCDSINGVFPQCTLPETPCTFNPCNTGDECIVDGADALCIATGILNCTCKFNLECLGVTFSTYKCLVPDVKVPYVEEDGCTLDIYKQERSHSILNISQFDLLYPKKRIHDFADGYVAYNVSSVSECPYMCRNSQYMSFSTQRMQCQCADSISPITSESLWVERKALTKFDSTREFCQIDKNNIQPESSTGMDYTHCHNQCLAQQDDFAVEIKEFAVWAGTDTDCSCLPYSFEDCYKFGIATTRYGSAHAAYIVGDIYEGIYEKKAKTCKTDNYNA